MQFSASQQIVTDLIRSLIEEAERMIYFNTLIRTKLTQYCYTQSIKYTHETYNDQYKAHDDQENCTQQKQPQALIQDNFFPAAAAIDQPIKTDIKNNNNEQKKEVRINRNKTQVSQSQISQPKKSQKQEQNSPFQQLNFGIPEQQQTILKELRKQILEQESKNNEKNKKNDQKPRKAQGKEKKQEKLGFDYNGQAIKVKSQNKNNLISGGLNGETLKTIEKTKQMKNNNGTTTIEYERKDKKLIKVPKNNQIQFTDIKTLLSEARVTKGAKFIEEGRIIEQKYKQIPVKQLMKSLSGRKLTKEQYKKIKERAGNVAQFDDLNASKTMNSIATQSKNQAEQNQSIMRSASQSKLSNSILTRRKSTITVGDPLLLENLISGMQRQASYKLPNSSIKNEEEKEQKNKFDSNDYYNLQYMKKGGSMIKKSKSIASLTDIKLPKIQASKQQMPRVRQRLKDKDQIVRTIRKKFQQKLRT